MAPLLETITQPEEANIYYTDEPLSMWIKDGDIFRSSSKFSLSKKLQPGMYLVSYAKELGIFAKKITNTSDTLYRLKDSKLDLIINEIDSFWDKADLYKTEGFLHKRGILLTGPPGTGKTSIIQLVSEGIINKKGIVFKIQSAESFPYLVSFIGTEFRQIEPDTPIVVILEKLDTYGDAQELLEAFLDANVNNNHMVILATTNHYDEIPSAILRASRFDLKIEIGPPDEEVRKDFLRNKNLSENEIELISSKTEGFTLADLKELYILYKLLGNELEEALQRVSSDLHQNGGFSKKSKFGITSN